MRALLDVNVLIALLDGAHVHHSRAQSWLEANISHGWASSPITQNGCIRILSQPAYPQPIPIAQAIEKLRRATATAHHEFWPDDVSALDAQRLDAQRVHGPKQLTDLYLLALAVRHGGRFVSFDARIVRSAVHGAGERNLVLL